MILADYLAKERVTLAAFAARVGRKVSTIHSWAVGSRRPPLPAVQEIEKATDGAVAFEDWVSSQRSIGEAKRAARAESTAA